MNRIFSPDLRPKGQPTNHVQQCLRPAKRLRVDAETLLRDVALVLSLTRRVKESILHDRELSHV